MYFDQFLRLLRATVCPVAVFAVSLVATWVYLSYLTPEKRAVRSRLSETDDKSKAAIDARTKALTQLFAKARNGAKAFAQRTVSWRGKWELVKGLANGGDSHRSFISKEYEALVISSEELRMAIESAIKGYMDDVEGFEGEMLVKLRADLANPERSDDALPASMRGDEVFRQEYQQLTQQLTAELTTGLGVTVGREVAFWFVAEEATHMALWTARTAAGYLGISGGILGVGASSSVATLGRDYAL